MRIESSRLAQGCGAVVSGDASKQQRASGLGEPGKQELEQIGIFDGALTRQPVLVAIVVGKLRLQTGNSLRRQRESGGDAAQLVGSGNTVGIIDGDQFAARERQGKVHGLVTCLDRKSVV